MDSIINYLGGKSKLSKQIVSLLPQHTCFIDLFGGAGWVLLEKPRSVSKVEVYNDLDSSLVNMFNVIKDDIKHSYLSKKFETTLISREIFENLKSLKKEESSDIDWAFRFLYLTKWSFSSRRSSDNSYNFGYSKKRQPVSTERIIDQIEEIYQRLKTTYIENLDYKEIIKKYDSLESLFFIDPPYIIEDVNTNYYKHNMNKYSEHEELKNEINKIVGKFILTLPNTEFYKDLYKGYKIIDSNVYYSSGNITKSEGDRGELIISNFDI